MVWPPSGIYFEQFFVSFGCWAPCDRFWALFGDFGVLFRGFGWPIGAQGLEQAPTAPRGYARREGE